MLKSGSAGNKEGNDSGVSSTSAGIFPLRAGRKSSGEKSSGGEEQEAKGLG